MSDVELAAIKKVGQELRYWKKFPFSGFATGVLNLEVAVGSLSTPDPFVYARKEYVSRWIVCKVGSQFKAMFHTAAVWYGSSHLETGNYVPDGQVPLVTITEGRLQRNASNRCQIDYTMDTRFDTSLFEYQAALEQLVVKNKEFNTLEKPRRNWQRGGTGYTKTFTFSAQMFVRPFGYDISKLKKPSYALHPWVKDVVQPKSGTPEYYANPHRPEIWDCTTGTMVRIDKASPPLLQRGDIVWMSFHVEFIVGQNTWVPQLIPRHIIRVGTIPAILIEPEEEEHAEPEQEPEYNIKEGSTFVMNIDFPMEDGMLDGIEAVNSESVNGSGASGGPVGFGSRGEEGQGQTSPQSDVGAGPSIASQTVQNTATPAASTENSRNAENGGHVNAERMDLDTEVFGGHLTPPPASPKPTTPAEWTPSPGRKSAVGSKNANRGTKRAGVADEAVIAQPAKKGRQAGNRRVSNM